MSVFIRHRPRVANINDVDRILEIERSSFPEYLCYNRNDICERICRGRALVSEVTPHQGPRKRRIAGYSTYSIYDTLSSCRILSIAVDPDYRGLGIGRRLMGRIIGLKLQRTYLEVDIQNKTARTLYESLGFKDGDLIYDYYGPGRHGITMNKISK